jgi:hypothetical protein
VKNTEVLGLRLTVSGYVVDGSHPPLWIEYILSKLVNSIGMSTGGMKAQVWQYPLDGKGGAGQTIVQVQPLLESFVVADTWPGHDHIFVVLASCKPYSIEEVRKFLTLNLGPVLDVGDFNLEGKGGPG